MKKRWSFRVWKGSIYGYWYVDLRLNGDKISEECITGEFIPMRYWFQSLQRRIEIAKTHLMKIAKEHVSQGEEEFDV